MRWVCGCCAKAGETASAAISVAPASACRVILPMSASSHWRGDAIATDRDGRGFESAVLLLGGAGDENLGAGLELVLAAGHIGHDLGLRRDDDLLLAVLVLERDHVAVD